MRENTDLVGGQAVIEGVMMRNKDKVAIAVRKKRRISVKKKKVVSLTKRHKLLGLPFVRGIVNLFEMLAIGIKALEWSANQALESETGKEEFSGWHLAFSLALAVVIGLILFKLIPLGITRFFYTMGVIGESRIVFNIIDGLIRVGLFVGYIHLISLFRDIRIMFQYHGAEHKAVYCYEAGTRLTVANARKFSTRHPRCGTSFVILVFVIAILAFSTVPIDLNFALLFFVRLLLVLPIAGIAYEALKLSAKFHDKWLFQLVSAPGIWLQAVTTQEPSDEQIAVAVKALKQVV